jgi:hypothetical protein
LFWCRHAKASQEVRNEYWQGIYAGKDIVQVRLDGADLATELTDYHAIDAGAATSVAHALGSIQKVAWVAGWLELPRASGDFVCPHIGSFSSTLLRTHDMPRRPKTNYAL